MMLGRRIVLHRNRKVASIEIKIWIQPQSVITQLALGAILALSIAFAPLETGPVLPIPLGGIN